MAKIQILNIASLAEEIIEFVKVNNLCDHDGTKNLEDFLTKKSRWLQLFNVQYSQPNGTGYWSFVSRKKSPTPGQPLVADAVVIIPVHIDKEGVRRLVLLREFRIPVGDYEIGFPAGLYNHNETAEEVAQRELKEETGLVISSVVCISPPMLSSAGLSDESVVMVFCECSGQPNVDLNEVTEDIEVLLVEFNQISDWLSKEKISAKTWPILYGIYKQGYI